MDWPDGRHVHRFKNGNANAAHPFATIPTPLRSHIFSFLDARSICRLSESCVFLHTTTSGKNLWYRFAKQDLPPEVAGAVKGPEVKIEYLAARHRVLEERRRREAEEEARGRHEHRRVYYKRCSRVFYFYQEAILTCLFAPLLTAFFALGMNALLRDSSMSWAEVSPLIALIASVFVGILCTCYVKYRAQPVPFDDETYHQSNGIIKFIINGLIGDENRVGLGIACLLLSVLLLFSVVLCLQLTNTVQWTWAHVFAPVFALLGSLCFMPGMMRIAGMGRARQRYKDCVLLWGVFLFPLFLFLLLLVVRHEVSLITVGAILTPAWLLNCLSCVACIGIAIDEKKIVAPLLWLVVFGPMVTFEVLWSLYDQNPSLGLSYTDVFSPFFVWCAFWVIGGMAFSYVVYQDSERRRREMVAAPAEVAAVDVVIDPVDAI